MKRGQQCWGLKKLLQILLIGITGIVVTSQGVYAQWVGDGNGDSGLSVELGTAFGEGRGQLPFWLHANRDGMIDREGTNGYLRLSYFSPYIEAGPLSYTFGGDLVARASDNSSLFLNQGYLKVRWSIFELTAGRTINPIGIRDTSLSAGSMILSRNASPVPKISLETPGFVDIPGTGGRLSFKGYFSHGWMENDRFVTDALLHQKYLYLRFSRPASPLNLYAGLSHHVIWAGTHPELGRLPQGFDDYIGVIFGRKADEESAPLNERLGRLGSAIASLEGAVQVNLERFRILAHRLVFFEIPIDLFSDNFWNGTWILSAKRKVNQGVVTGIMWSHLNSLQKGSGGNRGSLNLYNNGIYRTGWTYNSRTLGSPFLFAGEENRGVINNIVLKHQFGIEGHTGPWLDYRLLVAYSRNYGTRLLPTGRLDQYSFLLENRAKIRERLILKTGFAYDVGSVYEDQFGMMVGIEIRIGG